MTVLQDYSDVATGHRLQQVANLNPMPWDKRPSFWVAWPKGRIYGMAAGNSAQEALEALR